MNVSLISGRTREGLAAFVADAYAQGESLTATYRAADAATGAKTVNLVAPLYWTEIGRANPLPATAKGPAKVAAALRARRNRGDRFEVLAAASGLSVAKVRELLARTGDEGYTGRGTRAFL